MTSGHYVNMPQELFDALVEEHLAIQGCFQELSEGAEEPSDAAYNRLAKAWEQAAIALKKYTVPEPAEGETP